MTMEKMINSVRLKKLVTRLSMLLTPGQALTVGQTLHLRMLIWKML